MKGLDLIRVIAADPQPGAQDVRVHTVELYTDGLIVRWASPQPSAAEALEALEESRVHPPGGFGVDDDVGTTYKWVGMMAGGDGPGSSRQGMSMFEPAVPDGAGKLTILTPSGLVEVLL